MRPIWYGITTEIEDLIKFLFSVSDLFMRYALFYCEENTSEQLRA